MTEDVTCAVFIGENCRMPDIPLTTDLQVPFILFVLGLIAAVATKHFILGSKADRRQP